MNFAQVLSSYRELFERRMVVGGGGGVAVTQMGELLLELQVVAPDVPEVAVHQVVLHHELMRKGLTQSQDRSSAGARLPIHDGLFAAAHVGGDNPPDKSNQSINQSSGDGT